MVCKHGTCRPSVHAGNSDPLLKLPIHLFASLHELRPEHFRSEVAFLYWRRRRQLYQDPARRQNLGETCKAFKHSTARSVTKFAQTGVCAVCLCLPLASFGVVQSVQSCGMASCRARPTKRGRLMDHKCYHSTAMLLHKRRFSYTCV